MRRSSLTMLVKTSVLATALVTLSAGGQLAGAQTVDRSHKPAVRPAKRFTFPVTHAQTLDNGLHVVVVENHALPLVVVRLIPGADSLADPPGKEGLFALDTAMLREGTSSSSAEQQSATMAALGNAVSPLRFTTIVQNFDASLALMGDMLLHPAFPQAAFDRQKATMLATVDAQRGVTSTTARRILFAKLFGDVHPMARSVLATHGAVASITRDDVVRFHETLIRPNTSTGSIIVGDVRESEAMPMAIARRKCSADWKRGGPASVTDFHAVAGLPPALANHDLPPRSSRASANAHVRRHAGSHPRVARLRAARDDGSQMLGATPASRIQQNLRDRHSYVYAATPAAVVWRREPIPSMIYGSAAVAPPTTDSALIEWVAELRGMSERPPSEQEMTLARGSLLGTLPSQIETDAGVADRVAYLVQNDLPLDFYDMYVLRIQAVTPKEVRDAAARTVDTGRLVIVIAGDRAALEPALRAAHIAPVAVVDDNGDASVR